jgi:hypothetical protein
LQQCGDALAAEPNDVLPLRLRLLQLSGPHSIT